MNITPKPRKLSEPQKLLVQSLQTGSTLRHDTSTGLFRLTTNGRARTVHPFTVQSLIDCGIISKGMGEDCVLAPDRVPAASQPPFTASAHAHPWPPCGTLHIYHFNL